MYWLRRISYGNHIVRVSHIKAFSMMFTLDIIVWKIVVGVAQHRGNRIRNGVWNGEENGTNITKPRVQVNR